VWLPHSSLGFQRHVGRGMRCAALLRMTTQATIARSAIVACIIKPDNVTATAQFIAWVCYT